MKTIYMLITIIIFLSIIPSVNAYTLDPPTSINISGYVSSHNQIGIWWINPTDNDFKGTQIWFDNSYIGETSDTTKFYYAEFLSIGYHTFSTHTIDMYSNVNSTWVNITVENQGYYSCLEEWFAIDYCLYPKPPVIIINPENITPSQPSTQSVKNYTDITIWYTTMIATLGCLLFSRKLDIKTIRPILFAIIGFITSTVLVWSSLSIAYVGQFAIGNILEFTNQTNSMIYYYQVIKVVTQPWIVMLCIIISIFMIINTVDIGLRYLQEVNKVEEKVDWKI